MKLHSVFITHNRLELTKKAIASYIETVSVPCTITVVDNASTDGSVEWIREFMQPGHRILLTENRYPGYACNRGWEFAPRDATHLHRADNDFVFLSGWCEEVERMFSENESLGQLGLRTDEEELHAKVNVGGNCVIPRSLWDAGLRWDERTWPQMRDEIGSGWTEDSVMSKSVKKMLIPGDRREFYVWARVKHSCIQPISEESLDNEYYRRSWDDRGITETRYAYRPS